VVNLTEYGRLVQAEFGKSCAYNVKKTQGGMENTERRQVMPDQVDSYATLWQNVAALMGKHYGEENLSRLARECSIGLGTAARIKKQQTSVGIDILHAIATRFGLAPWQLLVPGFDPSNPPALQPVSDKERMLYERIMSAAKMIASENIAGGL